MSADERRESVIRAAMHEFARGGYYGTSTEAIAKRVGVSQPYLFRLFPNKQAIFLAASERCLRDTREVFAAAVEGLRGEEAQQAMANAYTQLIVEDPDKLQMQLQMYVTVAAAEAAGDHELGELVRKGWMELWDTVHVPLGADAGRPRPSWRTGCSSTPSPPWGSRPGIGSGRVSTPMPSSRGAWRSE